jgi:hypothetical protein
MIQVSLRKEKTSERSRHGMEESDLRKALGY